MELAPVRPNCARLIFSADGFAALRLSQQYLFRRLWALHADCRLPVTPSRQREFGLTFPGTLLGSDLVLKGTAPVEFSHLNGGHRRSSHSASQFTAA